MVLRTARQRALDPLQLFVRMLRQPQPRSHPHSGRALSQRALERAKQTQSIYRVTLMVLTPAHGNPRP